MYKASKNSAIIFMILGIILSTAYIIILMLSNFCKCLTILHILKALKIVTAVDMLLSKPITYKSMPKSALMTINISNRFQFD